MGNQAAFRHSGPAMYIYGFVRGRSALGGYGGTGYDLKRLSGDGASIIVWKISDQGLRFDSPQFGHKLLIFLAFFLIFCLQHLIFSYPLLPLQNLSVLNLKSLSWVMMSQDFYFL